MIIATLLLVVIALLMWCYVRGHEECSLICSDTDKAARLALLEMVPVSVWWLMSWRSPPGLWEQSAKLRNLGMLVEKDDVLYITERGRWYQRRLRSKETANDHA